MPLSKEKLEILIARSTDIVIATDAKGKVDYYNDGVTRSLGYSPDEILGQFVGQFYPDIDEAKRVMQAMRDPGYGGRGIVETFQTAFLARNGERIPVAISGTISYDENGEENGTVGFAKDLRDILRKDQLATLGEVALGLSHEINNPRAVILNQIEDRAPRAGGRRARWRNRHLGRMRAPGRHAKGGRADLRHYRASRRDGRDRALRDDRLRRPGQDDRPAEPTPEAGGRRRPSRGRAHPHRR
jgi:PAS domain S-box-containing protein